VPCSAVQVDHHRIDMGTAGRPRFPSQRCGSRMLSEHYERRVQMIRGHGIAGIGANSSARISVKSTRSI